MTEIEAYQYGFIAGRLSALEERLVLDSLAKNLSARTPKYGCLRYPKRDFNLQLTGEPIKEEERDVK
jgi:hypothetical protein